MSEKRTFAVRLHNPVAAWIILVCGFFVTGIAWYFSHSLTIANANERFLKRVSEIENAIDERIQIYEQLLWSGVGLFYASEEVSREEWKRYVDSMRLDVNWPGIQGLGYAIPVDRENLEAQEKQIRSEGFPEYSVKPTGERAAYSAIRSSTRRHRQSPGFLPICRTKSGRRSTVCWALRNLYR